MNCTSCGAGLGTDQVYCVSCGQRATPLGLPFVQAPQAGVQPQAPGSSRFSFPVPPQMATTLGALAIGFGFVIGNAISPGVRAISAAVTPSTASAPAPAPVAAVPLGDGGGTGAGGGGAAGGSGASAIAASTGDTPAPSGGGGNGGGGGDRHKKKRKKKQKPAKDVMTLVGTVVHTNPGAGSYAVAAGGALRAVHAADLPNPGERVTVNVRKLFNGTLAEEGVRAAQGTQQQATFSGVVTFRDETARVYTVSSRGSSVLVHVPATGDIPPPASAVTVTVSIGAPGPLTEPAPAPGPGLLGIPPIGSTPSTPATPAPAACDENGPGQPATPPTNTASALTQSAVTVDLPHAQAADLEAIVQAVCTDTGRLVLSADDVRESFSDIELALPSTLDAGRLAVGQPISVTSAIAADSSLAVTGFSSDLGTAGANDPAAGQGTQK